jgi:AcrR family transcriptional regulator
MPMSVHPDAASVAVRSEPVQPRAAARIEALLDAAAHCVDEVGSELLTTAMVAKSAGASIGTVYRYFPDRIAVLVALAGRNLERLRARFERTLSDASHATWEEAVTALLRDFIGAYREIPSFRSVRTGDWLDVGAERPADSTDLIAAETLSVLVGRFGVPDDDAARSALRRGFRVADALVMFAFQRDRFGDEEMLEMALEHGLAEAKHGLAPRA